MDLVEDGYSRRLDSTEEMIAELETSAVENLDNAEQRKKTMKTF